MFAEEKHFLQSLPQEPFRNYQHGKRTVHIDSRVEVDVAYYGAPPGWFGRQVDVQWDLMYVRLLDLRTGLLLREHLQQKRGRLRVRPQDRPRRKLQHTMRPDIGAEGAPQASYLLSGAPWNNADGVSGVETA